MLLLWANNLDRTVLAIINQRWINNFFDFIMPLLSDEHSGAICLVGFLIIIAVSDRRRGALAALGALIAVGIADPVVNQLIKPFFQRPRPCVVESVRLLANCTASYSFPSSHAANIFAYAFAIGIPIKRLLVPLAVLAIAVSYSRVYLGVHYPSDVLAGALFGLLVGWGIGAVNLHISKRWEHK